MSTKALREALSRLNVVDPVGGFCGPALAEVDAIEQAAKDLYRLSMGDFAYNIRDRAASDASFSGNTWDHPDVTAWGDASALMDTIAKEAP